VDWSAGIVLSSLTFVLTCRAEHEAKIRIKEENERRQQEEDRRRADDELNEKYGTFQITLLNIPNLPNVKKLTHKISQ
jgi:hypothetical protein